MYESLTAEQVERWKQIIERRETITKLRDQSWQKVVRAVEQNYKTRLKRLERSEPGARIFDTDFDLPAIKTPQTGSIQAFAPPLPHTPAKPFQSKAIHAFEHVIPYSVPAIRSNEEMAGMIADGVTLYQLVTQGKAPDEIWLSEINASIMIMQCPWYRIESKQIPIWSDEALRYAERYTGYIAHTEVICVGN